MEGRLREMTDTEKIISAIEHCRIQHSCNGCPYDETENSLYCIVEMEMDALKLLKKRTMNKDGGNYNGSESKSDSKSV